MSKNISDYIGKRYGHLVVIGEAPNNSNNPKFNKVELLCDCGNTIYLPFSAAVGGKENHVESAMLESIQNLSHHSIHPNI